MVWVRKPVALPAQLPEVSTPATVLGCFCKAAAESLVYSLISYVIALSGAGLHQTRGLQFDWDLASNWDAPTFRGMS